MPQQEFASLRLESATVELPAVEWGVPQPSDPYRYPVGRRSVYGNGSTQVWQPARRYLLLWWIDKSVATAATSSDPDHPNRKVGVLEQMEMWLKDLEAAQRGRIRYPEDGCPDTDGPLVRERSSRKPLPNTCRAGASPTPRPRTVRTATRSDYRGSEKMSPRRLRWSGTSGRSPRRCARNSHSDHHKTELTRDL
jgi:hypothetical protein